MGQTHLVVCILCVRISGVWRNDATLLEREDHEEVPNLNLRQTIPTSGLERQITLVRMVLGTKTLQVESMSRYKIRLAVASVH